MPNETLSPSAAISTKSIPPFQWVVDLHGPAIFRFCVTQVGAVDAEDCFQETMLAALRAYPSLRSPAALRAWLFSIAARKAIDFHRTQSRLPDSMDESAIGESEELSFPDDELWDRVRLLPEKQRVAITLRFVGDLTYADIAAVMETTAAAARRSVFEALKRLREEVEV